MMSSSLQPEPTIHGEGKLRFLCVADVPPNPDAGASGTQVRLVEWLRQIGHDVDAVWTSELPHRIKHPNSHDVFEKPIGYRNAVRKHVSAGSYDVICVNQPMGYLAAKEHQSRRSRGVFIRWSMGLEYGLEQALREWLPRWNLRKRSPIKTIPGKLLDRMIYRQECLIAKYADGHIVLCEKDRDYLIDHFKIPAERTMNVHQAPLELFQSVSSQPFTAERQRRILSVGQFIPYKAIYHIAEVVNNVLLSDPDALFSWGGCRELDRSSARALLDSSIQNRIEVPGKLDDGEFLRLFDSHGIFLFPSINEGFGKTFLEAMARGLCVVATNVGGMKDIIQHGKNGFLVEPGDIPSMAEHIKALQQDFDLARRISAAAMETSREYTWERVARDTATFCRKLLVRKQTLINV